MATTLSTDRQAALIKNAASANQIVARGAQQSLAENGIAKPSNATQILSPGRVTALQTNTTSTVPQVAAAATSTLKKTGLLASNPSNPNPTPAPKYTGNFDGSIKVGTSSLAVGADGKLYNAAGTGIGSSLTYDKTTKTVKNSLGQTVSTGQFQPSTKAAGSGSGAVDPNQDAIDNAWGYTKNSDGTYTAKDYYTKGMSQDSFGKIQVSKATDPTTGIVTVTYADGHTEQFGSAKEAAADGGDGGSASDYQPVLDSAVDYNKETIEGRMTNLLKTGSDGRFVTPAIQQAAEAAMAIFAQKGLLNSSMATQAALEAAVSKATDIASQDAQTYSNNRLNNVSNSNKFAMNAIEYGQQRGLSQLQQSYTQANMDKQQSYTLQNNYMHAMENVENSYNQRLKEIDASAMSPADKTTAKQYAQVERDASIRTTTYGFSKMSGWMKDWSGLVNVLPTSQAKPNVSITSDYTKWADDDLSAAIRYYSDSFHEDEVDEATFQKWYDEAKKRKAAKKTATTAATTTTAAASTPAAAATQGGSYFTSSNTESIGG